jgi:methionyl-tRNA formyltransferase
MQCVLAGSRYFGATVLEALRREADVTFACVIVPVADDRLAGAAAKAGLPVHVLANPKIVPGEAIPDGTDLIVAAHTHARISDDALARSRLGGIGYHPSLLPRHRGIAAVEWTVLEAVLSRAARSTTSPTVGTPARSRRRTGASCCAASRRASCGSARSRRWDSIC